jgi:hypothetical protein
MDTRDVQQQLLSTPWMASWIGRARAGNVQDQDLGRRAAAWAHWTVDNLAQMSGLHDRSYYAIVLPGKFYDPRGTGPQVRPHLEVSTGVLDRVDPEFPDRLALAGSGLHFPWWIAPEVTAVRRAVFNTTRGSVGDVLELVGGRRGALESALTELTRAAAPGWDVIEQVQQSSPDGMAAEAAGDFGAAEVADYFPAAAELSLEVVYDRKLRDVSGLWASRRVGVWQIRGSNSNGEPFSLGVVTPRLTANSQFKDQLFRAERESPAALLVRGLLLRRIVRRYLRDDGTTKVSSRRDPGSVEGPGQPHLRAVPARVGAKLPQASLDAAALFVQTYPNAQEAWEVMRRWAGTDHLLTVSEDGFIAAHKSAARLVRRAEEVGRDDVDVILPLAWDVSGDESRVVRVTFARGRAS